MKSAFASPVIPRGPNRAALSRIILAAKARWVYSGALDTRRSSFELRHALKVNLHGYSASLEDTQWSANVSSKYDGNGREGKTRSDSSD